MSPWHRDAPGKKFPYQSPFKQHLKVWLLRKCDARSGARVRTIVAACTCNAGKRYALRA